jgi:hypothetical protein
MKHQEFTDAVRVHTDALIDLYTTRTAYLRLHEPDAPYPEAMAWNPRVMGYEIGLKPVLYQNSILERQKLIGAHYLHDMRMLELERQVAELSVKPKRDKRGRFEK